MRYHVGISGWTYGGWRGVFYPDSLAHRDELGYASRIFNSIEINGTFYRLQQPKTYEIWKTQTPRDFVFSVKGSRYITHITRLADPEASLSRFFASGLLTLEDKLGPILWQLPPSFKFDRDRIEHFLASLPEDEAAAARLIQRFNDDDRGGERLMSKKRLRYCLEVRHASFMVPEFFELLQKYQVAFVIADSANKWPYAEDITADFVYIRLHGAAEIYASGYSDFELDWWSERIRKWVDGDRLPDARCILPSKGQKRQVKNVFVYFDNDVKVNAPKDAIRLAERLKIRG